MFQAPPKPAVSVEELLNHPEWPEEAEHFNRVNALSDIPFENIPPDLLDALSI